MVKPPSEGEKYLYLKTNKAFLYLFSVASFAFLISGIFLFSKSNPSLYWYSLYGILVSVYLSISFAIGIFSKDYSIEPKVSPPSRPTIDIFLPSCGEPIEIIKNTVLHAIKAASAYGASKVYVLDDAKNPELEFWCVKLGIPYIARQTNELKKAGNLRHAFNLTRGEWILILDADFACREDILLDLSNFTHDESVAIVQTPQFFRVEKGMGFIEAGSGFVQELFYRLIQVNRNHFGAPICVGTCGLYRRKALEPFGGTAPIGYSEDLHTGFQVMTHGWKVKYVPINYAAGLCPERVKSFFTQQYRWCMGSFSLMLTKHFWTAPKISFMHRICFLSGMLYYVTTAIGTVMTVVPSLVVLYAYPEMAHWYSVIFSVPSLVVGTIVIAKWSKHRYGLYSIESRMVSYWSHLFAIIDRLRGDLMPWVPTGNVTTNTRYTIFRRVFITYTVGLICAYLYGAHKHDYSINVIPMLCVAMFYRLLELKICYHLIKEK